MQGNLENMDHPRVQLPERQHWKNEAQQAA